MARLSRRASKIKAAAEAAYGKRGISQLAEASGISQQLLSFIVRGERTVSDEVYRKIADSLFGDSERLITASEKLGLLAGKMIAGLEK
ncbi:helix-turn-helix domain-containing protein [Bradyrhizobium sp. CCBAU 45384]|uniref:helix-turn-helix domain-containing protein n=1 Tax=Bradyrhizobium sp. CCBAU 45384 TaxID=858428 RepID=UPI0023053497|nr:helix-turn-helix transcriptional regulator [Bradyrhizobium sp. CCBAU 45384]MDA9411892.1 hypothetical protein [Bradyrhizobium sp. CCBAU 45384]